MDFAIGGETWSQSLVDNKMLWFETEMSMKSHVLKT
jgi:hypothetical protein